MNGAVSGQLLGFECRFREKRRANNEKERSVRLAFGACWLAADARNSRQRSQTEESRHTPSEATGKPPLPVIGMVGFATLMRYPPTE
jgi:hypothetical protein